VVAAGPNRLGEAEAGPARTGGAPIGQDGGVREETVDVVVVAGVSTEQRVPPAPVAEPTGLTGRSALSGFGLLAVTCGVPLVVALVALRQPRWYPGMDLALTELLIRDVGTADTPTVGLIGRFYALDVRGSHPGPLSFWLLWPLYRLFGSTAWALQAATVILNLLATGLALWIGQRRGGRTGALLVAVGVVVLARAYGADKLAEPWNPQLPLLWWLVFLLAVWSVLCGDLKLLPLVVLVGSFCAQTHIPYVALGTGLGTLLLGFLVVTGVQRRDDADHRRRLVRWGGLSLGLLVLLWLPPVVQQLTTDPGNLAVLRESFARPTEPPAGLRPALDVWLSYLDVSWLLGDYEVNFVWARRGSQWAGIALLVVWVVAAGLAWRRREQEPDLVRLHVVTAAALAVGLLAVSRILGMLVYWVVMWLWGITVLVLVAIAWTVVVLWRAHRPPGRARLPQGAVLAALLLAGSARFTYEAAHVRAEGEGNELSEPIRALGPEAAANLRSGDAPGGGVDGRYELRWPGHPGGFLDAAGFGILLELERHGFDVRTPVRRSDDEVPYRWADEDDPPPTAFLDYVLGDEAIARWRRQPGAVQVAYDEGTYEPAALFAHPGP